MRKSIRNYGLLYSVGMALNRCIPAALFRFRIFHVVQLESIPRDATRTSQRGKLGDEDVGDSPACRPLELSFRWFDESTDQAEAHHLTYYPPDDQHLPKRACLAFEDDEPAGGVWIGTQQFVESDLGIRIRMAPEQSWLFAAYVLKPFRRRGVYRAILDHVLLDQATTIFAAINPTNKASMAAHRPYVRRIVGRCTVFRVLNWTGCRVRGDLRVDRSGGSTDILIGTVSRPGIESELVVSSRDRRGV